MRGCEEAGLTVLRSKRPFAATAADSGICRYLFVGNDVSLYRPIHSIMSTPETTPEFIQLLTSSQSRLFAYVLSLLGDRQQAQDVMQETNMVLWRKSAQFRPGTNFGAWMLKVAYYQVMEHRRKLNKQAMFVADEEFLTQLAEEVVESSEVMEQQQSALHSCLERLPDRQRDIVRRRYTEGASIKAVAEQLGLAANAIKQTLFRARTSLIDCVRFRMKETNP
jgi:RNA polymerase sigma-70 factor, ECF subfamily